MNLRPAADHDQDPIREGYAAAFPNQECALVTNLAIRLLSEPTIPETLSIAAEENGKVLGHIALSPVKLDARAATFAL